MSERERFSFLENNSQLKRFFHHEGRNEYLYHYDNYSPTFNFEAKIIIPLTADKKMYWVFTMNHEKLGVITVSNFGGYDNDLSKASPWFQEFVTRSEQILAKRDKLRKFFV